MNDYNFNNFLRMNFTDSALTTEVTQLQTRQMFSELKRLGKSSRIENFHISVLSWRAVDGFSNVTTFGSSNSSNRHCVGQFAFSKVGLHPTCMTLSRVRFTAVWLWFVRIFSLFRTRNRMQFYWKSRSSDWYSCFVFGKAMVQTRVNESGKPHKVFVVFSRPSRNISG
jgi:hypothetical protein